MAQDHLGLFDTPPDRRQTRFGLVIVGFLAAALLLVAPIRDLRLPEVGAFIPMIDAVMCLGELIIAAFLFAQAAFFRSRALTILAAGYVFTALLLVSHALTFPGAFSADGLLGAGVNTTAWIAMFRRAGFAVAVIAYALLKQADASVQPGHGPQAARVVLGVLAATALAAVATILTTRGHHLLPPFYLNRADMIYRFALLYQLLMFALSVLAATVLFRKRSSVLDTWLLVVFACWLLQSLLIMTLQGRFTAGWYWLYVMILLSHMVVLLALIAEANRLYARFALATAARNREQQARVISVDAAVGAVAHDVGQPLNAVNNSVQAGLNWLTRAQRDPEKAIEALRDALDAGSRTTDVIKSIRALFARRTGVDTEVSLNDLVRATASLLDRELAGEKISLQLALDEALPPILADRVQIQRVLVNLVTNAIESVGATRERPRRIVIRTAALDGQDVLLEVSDNGPGIAPEAMAQIFEAFFTTKATGTGLGLSLCRTIVETHGGRLWASRGEAHGAIFHLQLPVWGR